MRKRGKLPLLYSFKLQQAVLHKIHSYCLSEFQLVAVFISGQAPPTPHTHSPTHSPTPPPPHTYTHTLPHCLSLQPFAPFSHTLLKFLSLRLYCIHDTPEHGAKIRMMLHHIRNKCSNCSHNPQHALVSMLLMPNTVIRSHSIDTANTATTHLGSLGNTGQILQHCSLVTVLKCRSLQYWQLAVYKGCKKCSTIFVYQQALILSVSVIQLMIMQH